VAYARIIAAQLRAARLLLRQVVQRLRVVQIRELSTFQDLLRAASRARGLEVAGSPKNITITSGLAICPTIDDRCRFEGTRHHHMDLKNIYPASPSRPDSGDAQPSSAVVTVTCLPVFRDASQLLTSSAR